MGFQDDPDKIIYPGQGSGMTRRAYEAWGKPARPATVEDIDAARARVLAHVEPANALRFDPDTPQPVLLFSEEIARAARVALVAAGYTVIVANRGGGYALSWEANER